jgi:hypothetical protein
VSFEGADAPAAASCLRSAMSGIVLVDPEPELVVRFSVRAP